MVIEKLFSLLELVCRLPLHVKGFYSLWYHFRVILPVTLTCFVVRLPLIIGVFVIHSSVLQLDDILAFVDSEGAGHFLF